MDKKVETRVVQRSEDDIDSTIKSITRKVQMEDLVKEGRTKNLKMIKESELRKILSTIIEKLISERDVKLSDKERELALLQSQSILSSKTQRAEILNDVSVEQGKLQERCDQLEQQLIELNKENVEYAFLLQNRKPLLLAIKKVLKVERFIVTGSELQKNMQGVDEASSIAVAAQVLAYIENYVAAQLGNQQGHSELQIELEAVREVFDEFKEKADQDKHQLQQHIKELELELAKAQKQAQASQQNNALEKEHETAVITRKLANVTSVKEVQSSEIKGLVAKVKKLESELANQRDLQPQLTAANDRIRELQRLQAAAEALKAQAASGDDAKSTAFIQEAAKLRDANKALTEGAVKSRHRLKELEDEIKKLQAELAALKQSLLQAQGETQTQKDQMDVHAQQAREKEAALSKRLGLLEGTKQGLEKVNAGLEEQLKQLQRQIQEKPKSQPETQATAPTLPKVKNRHRRPSALAHMDGDQRGSSLLLNGPSFDLVKRSGSKEGGAWRIYRKQDDHSLKAISAQPFKTAPTQAKILATWRVPVKNGERLLLETEDGHISIQGGDESNWNGHLDQLINSKPSASSGVSACLDPCLRQVHLTWCDEEGRLVHIVDVNAHYLTEYVWHVQSTEVSPYFTDCTTWYRSSDESLHIVALCDDDHVYHFSSTERSPWRMQRIHTSLSGIQVGSLCAYAPGAYSHLLLAESNGQLHEFWAENDEWHHETIGMTAASLPCAQGSRPIGGYTNDRHVIAYCNNQQIVNILEFTDEWRSVLLENTHCVEGIISAQFYGGEARLAWRDATGIQFSQRTDAGWVSSGLI